MKCGTTYTPYAAWGAKAIDLLALYQRKARTPIDADDRQTPVPATRLDTLMQDSPWGERWDDAKGSAFIDVLAQLCANRSELPLKELHAVLATAFGLANDHSLREHLVRSLSENGTLDVLRRADGRQRIVVGRPARFVAYRQGPGWRGSLVGIVTSVLRAQLESAASRAGGVQLEDQRGANRYLPGMFRVGLDAPERLDALSEALGLAPPDLAWKDGLAAPECLRITGALPASLPPEAYSTDAWWNWEEKRFERREGQREGVSLERRRDGLRTPIFVIARGSDVVAWHYSRTWSLLSAYETAGIAFLREAQPGFYEVTGRSPFCTFLCPSPDSAR